MSEGPNIFILNCFTIAKNIINICIHFWAKFLRRNCIGCLCPDLRWTGLIFDRHIKSPVVYSSHVCHSSHRLWRFWQSWGLPLKRHAGETAPIFSHGLMLLWSHDHCSTLHHPTAPHDVPDAVTADIALFHRPAAAACFCCNCCHLFAGPAVFMNRHCLCCSCSSQPCCATCCHRWTPGSLYCYVSLTVVWVRVCPTPHPPPPPHPHPAPTSHCAGFDLISTC